MSALVKERVDFGLVETAAINIDLLETGGRSKRSLVGSEPDNGAVPQVQVVDPRAFAAVELVVNENERRQAGIPRAGQLAHRGDGKAVAKQANEKKRAADGEGQGGSTHAEVTAVRQYSECTSSVLCKAECNELSKRDKLVGPASLCKTSSSGVYSNDQMAGLCLAVLGQFWSCSGVFLVLTGGKSSKSGRHGAGDQKHTKVQFTKCSVRVLLFSDRMYKSAL